MAVAAKKNKIRYGVVGLGHIAQSAVLPAFKNADRNSELTALISHDEIKLAKLSRKYKVHHTFLFDELEDCLKEGLIDVLYVATPNDHHKEIVMMAARYGVHVLCEKPMAVSIEDCVDMNRVAKLNQIKLMIAYRLHFEAANLEAVRLCGSGRLGELKFFHSTFSFQVKDKSNIRLSSEAVGGGAVYDIGVYCINAARYLFKDEPVEVFAFSANSGQKRFGSCDESTSVTMKFPKERLATFTISFGAFDSSDYEVIGSLGRIRLENAYDYAQPMKLKLSEQGKTGVKTHTLNFKKRDQFSAELLYFSNCIIRNIEPEPGGPEGLADIKIVQAILTSIKEGRPVSIDSVRKTTRPTKRQVITRPAIRKRKTIHVTAPSKH